VIFPLIWRTKSEGQYVACMLKCSLIHELFSSNYPWRLSFCFSDTTMPRRVCRRNKVKGWPLAQVLPNLPKMASGCSLNGLNFTPKFQQFSRQPHKREYLITHFPSGAPFPHQATIASADQTPLPRLWKRRWHVLGSLSGAIPSIRLYLYLYVVSRLERCRARFSSISSTKRPAPIKRLRRLWCADEVHQHCGLRQTLHSYEVRWTLLQSCWSSCLELFTCQH